MLFEMFKNTDLLPDGNNGILAVIRFEAPGQVDRLVRDNGLVRGSVADLGGATSWTIQGDYKSDFSQTADGYMTISGGVQERKGFMYPYMRIIQNGTTSGGTAAMRLALAFPVKLRSVKVISARAGMPFATGDDLLKTMQDRFIA